MMFTSISASFFIEFRDGYHDEELAELARKVKFAGEVVVREETD